MVDRRISQIPVLSIAILNQTFDVQAACAKMPIKQSNSEGWKTDAQCFSENAAFGRLHVSPAPIETGYSTA